MLSEPITVSIIITVKNGGIDLYTTMESLKVSRTTLSYEVIIVDEGSVDGCCDFLMGYRFERPIKRLKGEQGIPARNVGAAHATGKYLIFCGAHLYYDDYWMEKLLEPLMAGEADCSSPSFKVREHSLVIPSRDQVYGLLSSIRNYPLVTEGKALTWLSWECFAVHRDKFRNIGGIEDGFIGKEMETAEFSLRIWLLDGFCAYVPEVSLVQVFRQNFPYDDSMEQWGSDLLTLAHLHFSESVISVCRQQVYRTFKESEIAKSEGEQREAVELRRHKYAYLRKYDDTWFLTRFGITFEDERDKLGPAGYSN